MVGGDARVGGYRMIPVDEGVRAVVAYVLEQRYPAAELDQILAASAQVVSGTNYDVTFTLTGGETCNAAVHKSLSGELSMLGPVTGLSAGKPLPSA